MSEKEISDYTKATMINLNDKYKEVQILEKQLVVYLLNSF